MKTHRFKKFLKDTSIINKPRTHPSPDKFSTNRNFPQNLTYKLNATKRPTNILDPSTTSSSSNRNSHLASLFDFQNTDPDNSPWQSLSLENTARISIFLSRLRNRWRVWTREKAGDTVALDDEWKLARLEIFKVVVARCCEPWVLRSRRGWGGGRAHGRAPPLPKGTYISWLAAGVTRSYNTIASASSATRHASSSEYSSLSLFFALIHSAFKRCFVAFFFLLWGERKGDGFSTKTVLFVACKFNQ